MGNETERVSISRLTERSKSSVEDVVATEFPLTIILNYQELVTLLCSPTKLRYLAAGFLLSEGLISSKNDIKKIITDDQKGRVWVETENEQALATELPFKRIITSGCGRGASFYSATDARDQVKVESQLRLSIQEVFSLVSKFQHHSGIYRTTGGVHGAALCDTTDILLFSEDIGRHNAIDKIFGECLLEDMPTDDRAIITSGRISSEILLKVAKRDIPIIISRSAPTNVGVRLANDLGITIIGFARGKRMNIYANDWRITAGEG